MTVPRGTGSKSEWTPTQQAELQPRIPEGSRLDPAVWMESLQGAARRVWNAVRRR